MSCPKGKEIFRLYSQNINSLKLNNCGGDLSPISDFMNEYQCDMAGFSEINVNVSKYSVRKIITDTLNKEFDPTIAQCAQVRYHLPVFTSQEEP
jgi:hypothetical protein